MESSRALCARIMRETRTYIKNLTELFLLMKRGERESLARRRFFSMARRFLFSGFAVGAEVEVTCRGWGWIYVLIEKLLSSS